MICNSTDDTISNNHNLGKISTVMSSSSEKSEDFRNYCTWKSLLLNCLYDVTSILNQNTTSTQPIKAGAWAELGSRLFSSRYSRLNLKFDWG